MNLPMDQPLARTSREQLLYALTEAAEIEHGLMCCYLYAAWSLKRPDELDQPEQREAVARWRSAIMGVAIEEMSHLALVSNLLVALGARPHFIRQNMPVALGVHPSGITVELAPFNADTVDHFLFLERPHGSDLRDGASFAAETDFHRLEGAVAEAVGLTPGGHDYATVGDLYHGIIDGLTTLVETEGEAAAFPGNPRLQLGPPLMSLPGLQPVTDLASACNALATIVDQGEGARADHKDSHFARFGRIKRELAEMSAADPSFTPAWPAARNPVLRPPPVPEGRVQLTDPTARHTADLAAACYGVMLRGLQLAWAVEGAERATLIDQAITAMEALSAIGEGLARMPACSDGRPGVNAGFSFTCPRSLYVEWDAATGPALFAERLRELAPALAEAAGHCPGLPRVAERMGATLPPLSKPAAPPTPHPLPGPDPDPAPGPEPIEEAHGRDLDILFLGKRCIHSRHCVLGAPETFLANTPGEWIFPDATPTERLVGIAHDCPSGAIRYRRNDGGAEELPPPVNELRLRENGPYAVHAELQLDGDPRPAFRATLCRCGQSKNKPFCDSSHIAAGFSATGEPPAGSTDPLETRNGPLVVTPLRNGPLQVDGSLEICAGTGHPLHRTKAVKLCRCGGSSTKPICDGTHRRNGFEAPGR